MSPSITKRQHYVWRAYLAAWMQTKKIYCLREGNIFSSNLMGVAQERYFYRLHNLNAQERELIRQFAQASYGALKATNEQWLQEFTRLFDLKTDLVEKGLMNGAAEGMFKEAELQLEESLHSTIEGASKKYLDMLLREDTSFYEDANAAMEFCFFFAMQYVRTPRILQNMKQGMAGMPHVDPTKVWSVLKIMVATNIAANMVGRRAQFGMYLLSSNASRFITGDQPIINTNAVDFESPPNTVEWFYPVSPHLAVLISESAREKVSSASESEVTQYNEMIFKASHKQVYAVDKSDLKPFVPRS